MTIQAIYKKAVDGGYDAKVERLNSGEYAVFIDGFGTINFFGDIMQIYKRSRVHIDYNTAAFTACIMDNTSYKAHKEYNDKKTNIVNIFWEAIHNGCSPEKAQKMQYEYAQKYNCIDVYSALYA